MYASQQVQGVWVHFNVIYVCVIWTQGTEQDVALVKGPLWECPFLELTDQEPQNIIPSMLLISPRLSVSSRKWIMRLQAGKLTEQNLQLQKTFASAVGGCRPQNYKYIMRFTFRKELN